MLGAGITLQPEEAYLERLAPLFAEDADYFEVAPETLWLPGGGPDVAHRPNGFWHRFRELKAQTNKPFVAHGVGLSLGTVCESDAPRLVRWLANIRKDHDAFDFAWYTDHLGATTLDGRAITLPVPLPMTDAMAVAVRARVAALQTVVPDAGFENAVFYFLFGKPLDEPAFFNRILTQPRMHLLLDLHNVVTMAENFSFDPIAYMDAIDLGRVIEIHIAGGGDSDPRWLPDGKTMRLDSHDGAVPESVWELLAWCLPRCRNLRGVTLERMEGTVGDEDVPLLREEMRRLRRMLEAA